VSSHDESADRKQRIEEIIAACLDAREAGADLSLEEIVARYPEFEKELRDFFENEGFFTSVLGADDRRPYFGNDYEVLKEIGRGGMGVVSPMTVDRTLVTTMRCSKKLAAEEWALYTNVIRRAWRKLLL